VKVGEIFNKVKLNIGSRWGDTEAVMGADGKITFKSRTLGALKDAEKDAKRPTREPVRPTGKDRKD
jgi:hypothetical protein